jgi:type IV pilus assembly protein PilA
MSGCAIAAIVVGVLLFVVGGPVAALGIYGVRKYLAAAKTAEAKNTVGAISRAAVAAYERERPAGGDAAHRLCDSAVAVPAKVPSGAPYLPSSAAGADYQSGTADAGWTCLKFAMTGPQHYQYGYVKGAGTGKSGATANGFEATARGDLDGNGTTSLFARGATVRNGQLVLSSDLYIENEFE